MQQHGRSPRKRKFMLYFTYGVMTTAVVLISTLCIFLVLGYRLDFKSGDVEQGSLLQFRSFPQGAAITLDAEVLSFVTPGKRNVEAGKHTVTMQLDGYHAWEKTVSVKPSELRWLNYARLIPTTLSTATEKEFPLIRQSLPSPDRKWIMLQLTPDRPEFILVDIRDDDKPIFSQLTLPASSYTEQDGTHTFELVEWDFGARYMLVKHTVGSVSEYIRLDRTDVDKTVNISNKLGVSLQDIHFSGTNGSVFYALSNGTIRRLDSDAGVISQPIVKDVTAFRLFKTSTLAYVKQAGEAQLGVGVVIDNKAVRVATYDSTVPIVLDINEYFNEHYLAIGRGTTIDIYKDPELETRAKIATVPTVSALSWLRFGSNGRFVTSGTGSQFTTYDLETKESHDVNLPGTAADPAEPLQWLDDYYLVSTAGNDLRITEFDGANQHVIASTLPGSSVTLNDNGRYLYSIGRTQSGSYVLQSTAMTTRRN